MLPSFASLGSAKPPQARLLFLSRTHLAEGRMRILIPQGRGYRASRIVMEFLLVEVCGGFSGNADRYVGYRTRKTTQLLVTERLAATRIITGSRIA